MISISDGAKRLFKSTLIISMAFSVAVGSSSQVYAAETHYGVEEWIGILSSSDSSYKTWGCGGDGRLMCYGMPAAVNSKDTFIALYHDMLYDPGGANAATTGNPVNQNQRVAAFTILSMMGVDRSEWASKPTVKDRINKAISLASDNYAAWEKLVTAYDTASMVNYSTDFTYSTNTAYRKTASGYYDIIWHKQDPQAKDASVVFTLPDGRKVAIKRACGNMVGDNAKLDPVNNWSVSVGTSVKIQEADGIAKPGNTIVWTHGVKNDGPDTTTKDVVYEAQNGEGMAGMPGLGSWTMVSGTGKGDSGLKNTTHLITQDDVGKKLCRSTKATPRSSTSAEPIGTEDYCVIVPYAYSLTPSVSISSSAVEPGTELAISSSVANAGPTKSRVTRWQLSYITIPSGGSVPTMADSVADPCAYYSGGGMTCAVASFKYGADSVNDIVYPTPVFNYATRYVDADDLPVGTKVCYSLSVNQRSDNPGATVWRHSAPACVVVAKRPKVQVWGSDLSARGDIYSNTTTKSGRTYGSWGEYGLLASGGITGMSSASGLSGGSASSVQSAWSRLSFANVINATSNTSASNFFGQYATTSFRPLPAIQPRLAATIPASGATLPGVVGGVIDDIGAVPSGSYSHSGNLTIRRSNISVGKSVILKVTGKVTIVDDITYDGGDISSADYGQIPQLVLMADSIDIASNVTNVDSWLIAPSEYGGSGAGAINTCSTDNSGVYMAPTAPLSASLCDKILRINGPVVANNLFLRRTGGSGTGAQSGDPAEIINLRADAYLWAYARTNVAGKAQTIMTTELPPRF